MCLDPLNPYPDEIKNLFLGHSKEAKNFRKHIRKYNYTHAFASCSLKPAKDIRGPGPSVVRICGQIYHRTGPLHPKANESPLYGQLYFYDGEEEVEKRLQSKFNSEAALLRSNIDTINRILNYNPFAQSFKQMRDIENEERADADRLFADILRED